MTRQVAAPIEHINLSATNRTARELAKTVLEGHIDMTPSYQRGPVWTEDQKVALVYSWLRGLPTGVIILSDRANSRWAAATGDVYRQGVAVWAVIDGKQRLSCAVAWFASEFAVPASYFESEMVARTESTDDGPYVRFNGLTEQGQREMVSRAMMPVAETRSAATIADEAVIYLLVNGGGTPQTDDDMQRARDVTGR